MNTPVTCFTALISIAEEEQCEELEEYLRSKGSDIVTSNDVELVPRLEAIIDQCGVVFVKDLPQEELEGFFYSVVSLFHVVSFDEVRRVVNSFCLKIVEGGTSENAECRLKLLGLIFCHFSARDTLRFTILCHRVKLAGQIDKAGSLCLDLDQLCQWIDLWNTTVMERRELYTLLWEAYRNWDNKKLPVRILKELLLTYDDSDASEAKTYAEELIVMVISDPTSFVFDDTLELAPVKMLEKQKIHDMLRIFVYDRLSSYQNFYTENTSFVEQLKLNHECCVTKMRQLTLASMAAEKEVLAFSALREELQLSQEQLEEFIVNSIRQNLVEARINQVNETLVVRSSVHRTFGKEQWSLLHDRLSTWQQGIQTLKSSLKTIAT